MPRTSATAPVPRVMSLVRSQLPAGVGWSVTIELPEVKFSRLIASGALLVALKMKVPR